MDKRINQVTEFSKMTGSVVNTTPMYLHTNVTDLRIALMQEELDEYKDAVTAGNLVDIADALADLEYVLLGTVIAHGLQHHFTALFDEVHRSNMAKGIDGVITKRDDGKILKPESWTPPDLTSIIEKDPEEAGYSSVGNVSFVVETYNENPTKDEVITALKKRIECLENNSSEWEDAIEYSDTVKNSKYDI